MKLFGYVLMLFVLFLSLRNKNKNDNKQNEKINFLQLNRDRRGPSGGDELPDVFDKFSEIPRISSYNINPSDLRNAQGNYYGSSCEDCIGGGPSGSDIRLKKNIKKLKNSLEKIEKLDGVQFNWKDNKISKKHNEIGFIAQEVQKEYPELIFKLQKDDKSQNPLLGVDYPKFTAILLEGLKEINNKVKLLENKINLK